MIELTYGIFAEDSANEIFIEKIIPQLTTHFGYADKISFKHNWDYTLEVDPKSGGYVSKFLVNLLCEE